MPDKISLRLNSRALARLCNVGQLVGNVTMASQIYLLLPLNRNRVHAQGVKAGLKLALFSPKRKKVAHFRLV